MEQKNARYKSIEHLHKQLEEKERELEELRYQFEEAKETIEAIRSGQIDALVVDGKDGHQLYTLQTADRTYRVFIEKMTEGAVTLSQEGTILYANTQFANMVQLPLSSVIGLTFDDFVAPDGIADYKELFANCWNADTKGEVNLLCKNDKIPVQLSLTTLELQDGLALSIIITDLSFQKTIQEQLRQRNDQLEIINRALEVSNHDLQQFASVASHDLQEPVRKILIFSHLLRENLNTLSSESRTYIEKIIESSTRMKRLIIDILSYSRLSANEIGIEEVNLNDLTRELIEDYELQVEEKNAKIIVGNLPLVHGNKGQLRQVFQNIISNALKFAKAGVQPIITISGKRIATKSFDSTEDAEGDFALITFEDNGIGFDEIYLSKVFALFDRLNSKDKYEGTGIGMSIAKKIIDKHNGLITASSKEGAGANFKIILPLRQTAF
jgi:PAS domain S-box-containing protein